MFPKNKKIGIDIDETLATTFETIFNSAKDQYGWTVWYHETVRFHDWWNIPELGITKEQAFKIFDDYFQNNPEDRTIYIVEGAKEWIAQLLSMGYEVPVITARTESTRWDATRKWLKRNFPNIPKEHLYFTNHYHTEKVLSKWEVCKNLEVSVLVDDNITFLESASEFNIHGILLDRPWNQNVVLPKNTQRVHHWNEIPDLIQSLTYEKN